jgi:uncharacterized protein (DUF2336 family)
VLTDLYVQKTPHSAEEERHYTELVLGLLDAVDLTTRAGIAQKLAAYPTPPAMVVRKLARDVIQVAEPVLRHCRVLSGSDLLSIIRDCGPRHAAVIATRNQAVELPPAPPRAESVDLDAIFDDALDSPAAPAEVAVPDRAELADMFLASDASARRALLASLSGADAPESAVPAAGPASEIIRNLEAAALERRPQEFARLLEQGLAISSAHARRITEDPLGEPLLVAARALDMPADVLLRVLLFLNPTIGESVQRVFDLARFYERLSAEAAHSVVASMRTGERKPRHQPLHYDDEAVRRRGAAPAARRFGTSEPRGQLPLRDAVFGTRQRTN